VKGLNLQQVRVSTSETALQSIDPKGEATGWIILHDQPNSNNSPQALLLFLLLQNSHDIPPIIGYLV